MISTVIIYINMVFIAVDCLTEALERTLIASIQVFHWCRSHKKAWTYLLCSVYIHTVGYTLACDSYVIFNTKEPGV